MSKSFIVSFFVDKCSDEEMNSYIGSRFIPYIYELVTTQNDLVFLLPYGYVSSCSVARTVRVVAKHHPGGKVRCRFICGCLKGFFEKMVDMSDLSLFYIENSNGKIYSTMKYAERTNKKYIRM